MNLPASCESIFSPFFHNMLQSIDQPFPSMSNFQAIFFCTSQALTVPLPWAPLADGSASHGLFAEAKGRSHRGGCGPGLGAMRMRCGGDGFSDLRNSGIHQLVGPGSSPGNKEVIFANYLYAICMYLNGLNHWISKTQDLPTLGFFSRIKLEELLTISLGKKTLKNMEQKAEDMKKYGNEEEMDGNKYSWNTEGIKWMEIDGHGRDTGGGLVFILSLVSQQQNL